MSREALGRWRECMLTAGRGGKALLGVLLVAVGALILTGLDKRLETVQVQASPDWLTQLTTRF
jgi:cytochrome c-type biogenesis protein